ncbi:zinc-binding dehydrogenase [Paenarthrobacter aurescens]|uniref:zinc-binding dehydrogenase n=1 Tax=Paenarthrobacter aurescens TaxID=43663 RepID=UPI0021C03B62|nr:zinc-binding dehydrogenase [Paenarthrobacter aurescens]MCT9868299.1 zinc-binding dehydrogenase [Paenarthrobacter aurescens]
MAVTEDESVLVNGAGSQGQCVIASLIDRGIKPAVVEPNRAKFERALEQGARDTTLVPTERFQVVFETSGVGPGLISAIDNADALGRICLIGQSAIVVPLPTRPIVQKELCIQGSVIYNHPADFASAVHELNEAVGVWTRTRWSSEVGLVTFLPLSMGASFVNFDAATHELDDLKLLRAYVARVTSICFH